MGKLLNEIQAAPKPKQDRVAELVRELGDDGPDLLKALNDSTIKTSRIHRALVDRGVVVGYSTLQLWRRAHGIV
jgi:hypothetical protein